MPRPARPPNSKRPALGRLQTPGCDVPRVAYSPKGLVNSGKVKVITNARARGGGAEPELGRASVRVSLKGTSLEHQPSKIDKAHIDCGVGDGQIYFCSAPH